MPKGSKPESQINDKGSEPDDQTTTVSAKPADLNSNRILAEKQQASPSSSEISDKTDAFDPTLEGGFLKRKLSPQIFILSMLLILLGGLIYIGVIYYIVNIQYTKQQDLLSQIKSSLPLTKQPTGLFLELQQPDDDLLTYRSPLLISGKTAANKNVYITSNSDDILVKSEESGEFSTSLDLSDGVNVVTVTVFDEEGNAKSAERVVYYSKEKL